MIFNILCRSLCQWLRHLLTCWTMKSLCIDMVCFFKIFATKNTHITMTFYKLCQMVTKNMNVWSNVPLMIITLKKFVKLSALGIYFDWIPSIVNYVACIYYYIVKLIPYLGDWFNFWTWNREQLMHVN